MKPASKLLIEEPEFEEVRRGYDRDQVNSFLERIDDAVAELQRQLTQATERARAAEAELAARPAGGGAPPETDGTEQVNRLLVLAQRTADAAIAEAKEEADQHLSQARTEAEEHVGRARTEGDRLALEAEAYARNQRAEADRHLSATRAEAERISREAREGAQATRVKAQADLVGELRELEANRDAFRNDITLLDRHLEAQRTRLGHAVEEIRRVLDDPAVLRPDPLPELAGTPVPADPEPSGNADHDDTANAAGDDTVTGEESQGEPGETDPAPDDELISLGDTAVVSESHVAVEAPEEAPVEQEQPEAAAAMTGTGDATGDEGEDAFLAELRKAMTDEEPLGPRDTPAAAAAGGTGQPGGKADADDSSRPRFGRRR